MPNTMEWLTYSKSKKYWAGLWYFNMKQYWTADILCDDSEWEFHNTSWATKEEPFWQVILNKCFYIENVLGSKIWNLKFLLNIYVKIFNDIMPSLDLTYWWLVSYW